MWNTFKEAGGQHILFQFILSLAGMRLGCSTLYKEDGRARTQWTHSQAQKASVEMYTTRRAHILQYSPVCQSTYFQKMTFCEARAGVG